MNNKDKLTALLLEQCIAEFEQSKGGDGSWPESAVIVLKDRFHYKFFGLGKPVRAWHYDGGTPTEIDSSEAEEHLNAESNRVHYRTARFLIAFPEDLSAARLTVSLGPKFGAIYLYDVICDGDNISLGERRCVGMM